MAWSGEDCMPSSNVLHGEEQASEDITERDI